MTTSVSILLLGLIGVACVFTAFIFLFKKPHFSILAAGIWGMLAYNGIGAATVGNFSDIQYVFGVFCALCGIFCITTLFFAFHKEVLAETKVEKPDYYEDMQMRADKIRKMRRRRNPWDS